MAGRGFLRDTTPINNSHLFAMRNGIFRAMYVPVNPDRSFSGVCLAESFADLYQKDTGVDTGLIPCADGGRSRAFRRAVTTCLYSSKVMALFITPFKRLKGKNTGNSISRTASRGTPI